MTPVHVLAVASECFPYVKTGGLADVAGALPQALNDLGHDTLTLIPGYPQVLARLGPADVVDTYGELYGGPARVLLGHRSFGQPGVLVVDAPHLFDRPGHPYQSPDGRDWDDNAFRFAALAVIAREIGFGRLPFWRPDVIHAHDWQAGLVPAYMALDPRRPRPATVATVHNLAFQGQFPADRLAALGLPSHAFAVAGVEYYGGIGFLKAALFYADKLTTVSPTYAREIRTPEGGMGLDGLLASRGDDLVGIVNGIDTAHWDPANDPMIDPPFDAERLQVRRQHKAALQAALGLQVRRDLPLFCVISRLTWQKGMDVLLPAVPALVEAGGQLAVLGSGDAGLEAGFGAAAGRHPGRVATRIGYDEPLSHRLQAGSDAILIPSRFEPCGLTQLYGLRYGCVPVVAATGGLVDTVVDADSRSGATGIVFEPGRTDRLIDGILRAIDLWKQPARWSRLQRRGMAQDLGWASAAGAYVAVFEAALAQRY
ncbi:MAG: glycogen synthase GlgA [Pseudomonadota bacterium]